MRKLAVCLLLVLATAWPVGARQDWRATAIASFDDVWQTINETFYDPTFGGLDWPGVRAELRPQVEAAASPEAARDGIRQMLARLGRSHFQLLSPSGADALPGWATIAVDLRVAPEGVVITRVAPGSAAGRAGLRPGDVVLGVDSATAESWTAAAQGSDARIRAADVWRRAYRAIHGAFGSTASIRLRAPGGAERVVSVVREAEDGDVVTLGNLPPLRLRVRVRAERTPQGRSVGVIAWSAWMATASASIDQGVDRFRQDAGLIFDVRGNPGGLLLMMSGVAGHVVADASLSLGTIYTRQAPAPLRAPINPRLSTDDGRRVTPFAGPVAILVDELTASASECFAGGLQGLGRARVFGRQTMGQALPASTRTLPSGDVLLYAVGDFVTAGGRRLEGQGVVPDETQPLSIAALSAGRDLPLEAALRWIDTARR